MNDERGPLTDSVDLSTPAGDLPSWALPDHVRLAGPGASVDVDRAALVAFAAATLRQAGARRLDAAATAETLVLSDARGHASHGVSRLRQYLRLADAGAIDVRARHEVVARRSAIETWDARRGLGPAVGHRAMARAVQRARRAGLAAVVVRDAGHFGIAGAYVLRAMAAGMIGIVACNADARVPPTGARARGLGTNPIAVGAPDGAGRGFLLDMATSVVALGKVEVAKRAGTKIPEGWALDARGRPTRDPDAALEGMLMPLGGEAQTAGYKGYGLAAAVELLTGVLGGGAFGLGVAALWDTSRPASTSQLHLAIDPGATGDASAFSARLRSWLADLKALPRRPGVAGILIAGEREWRAEALQAARVMLLPNVVEDLAHLAVERGLGRAWRRVVAQAA